MVLACASPGQEKGATPPSVALLRTDLERLVMGICLIVSQDTHKHLLNHKVNTLNHKCPALMLVSQESLAPNKMSLLTVHIIQIPYNSHQTVERGNKINK